MYFFTSLSRLSPSQCEKKATLCQSRFLKQKLILFPTIHFPPMRSRSTNRALDLPFFDFSELWGFRSAEPIVEVFSLCPKNYSPAFARRELWIAIIDARAAI